MMKDIFYKWHKKTLQKHTTELDVDAIWSSIESDVDAINVSHKKRRRFFFLLSFIALGILSAGFIGLSYFNQTPTTQHINPNEHITTITSKQGTQIASIEADTKSEQNVLNPSYTATPIAAEKNTTIDQTLPPNISSPSSSLKNDDIKKKIWKYDRPNSTSKIHLTKSSYDTAPKTQSSIIFDNSTSTSSTVVEKVQTPSFNLLENNRINISIPETLPSTKLTELSENEREFESIKIDVNKTSPFSFAISAYSGLALVNRTLTAKNTSEPNELLFLRENTEKSLELWNNGIKAKLIHKSGFNLSFGIQYSRLAENLNYDIDFLKENSIDNQVVGYSTNLLGDESKIIGSASNNTIYDIDYDFYNYHHFIDVPISIGYRKRFGLWSLGLRTGAVYNLSLQSKGRILNNPYTVTNIGAREESPFVERSSLSYEGGISAYYRLTRHIEVGLEAYHRYAPNSILNDTYQLQQKYSWTGLNASINYLF